MKILNLLRHAQAENGAHSDFSRNLNKAGREEASRIGKLLKEHNIIPDSIISSPASRAMQTLEIITYEIGFPLKKAFTHDDIYTAEESDLLAIIRETDPSVNELLLIGHNPALSGLAQAMTGAFHSSMVTSGFVIIELMIDTWQEINWRKGKLIEYIIP